MFMHVEYLLAGERFGEEPAKALPAAAPQIAPSPLPPHDDGTCEGTLSAGFTSGCFQHRRLARAAAWDRCGGVETRRRTEAEEKRKGRRRSGKTPKPPSEE